MRPRSNDWKWTQISIFHPHYQKRKKKKVWVKNLKPKKGASTLVGFNKAQGRCSIQTISLTNSQFPTSTADMTSTISFII